MDECSGRRVCSQVATIATASGYSARCRTRRRCTGAEDDWCVTTETENTGLARQLLVLRNRRRPETWLPLGENGRESTDRTATHRTAVLILSPWSSPWLDPVTIRWPSWSRASPYSETLSVSTSSAMLTTSKFLTLWLTRCVSPSSPLRVSFVHSARRRLPLLHGATEAAWTAPSRQMVSRVGNHKLATRTTATTSFRGWPDNV